MSKVKPALPTAEFVRRRFDYDPMTGLLTYSGRERAHLAPSLRSRRTGKVAGGKDTNGHLQLKIGKRSLSVHRLIWLHVTGEWPDGHIDHINGIRDDNRWHNLRVVSAAVNMQNRRAAQVGTFSGVLGVSPGITPGTWLANIRANGVAMRLGTFPSKEEAYEAYLNAKALVHPEAPLVADRAVNHDLFTETAVRNLKRAGYL